MQPKKCKHPTCSNECRREVKPKKVYILKKVSDKKKVKKIKCVPLPKLKEKAQKVFNAFIRERDKGMPCISCGSLNANQAGHYFPVGRFSALRYHPDNCHLQCAGCNCYAYGNQAMYRIGLVKRIGVLAMEALEREAIETPVRKWTREELMLIIDTYKPKKDAA